MGTEEGKSSCTVFHGHSGPIYSATFSPLGDFLLSSSSDSTSKLSFEITQFLPYRLSTFKHFVLLLFLFSSIMEPQVECKSCLLQRAQLPCMGCAGNIKSCYSLMFVNSFCQVKDRFNHFQELCPF